MTLTELKEQIAFGEDSRRQFKRDVANADSLAAEMAAFANCEENTIFPGGRTCREKGPINEGETRWHLNQAA